MRNRAFAYGDGVFETIRVSHGRLPLWSYHWRRLKIGAARLGLDTPEADVLHQAMQRQLALAIREPLSNGDAVSASSGTPPVSGVLKLVLFRHASDGHSRRGYCPAGSDSAFVLDFFPNDLSASLAESVQRTPPLHLKRCDIRLAWQPRLAGIKHLNRLENVLACAEVQAGNYDDGLLLDGEDNIIEATSSNVVLLRGSDLLTPDLSRCGVHGVALSWLQAHFPVRVASMPFSDLHSMDAMLICNSVAGFRVVTFAAGHPFDVSLQKPLVRQRINEIMNAWCAACRTDCQRPGS